MQTQTSNVKSSGKPNLTENEGEGSRTAARDYEAGVQRTIASGKVDELAAEAREAIAGPEGPSLRAAEKAGKKGTR